MELFLNRITEGLTSDFILADTLVQAKDSAAGSLGSDVVVVDHAQVSVDEGHGHVGPDHRRLALRLRDTEGHVLVLVDEAGKLDRDGRSEHRPGKFIPSQLLEHRYTSA